MTHWLWGMDGWQEIDSLPADDRGLQYGDGLFETMRITSLGQIPLLPWHLERLEQGLQALFFPLVTFSQIKAALQQLPAEALRSAAKLTVTRGSSERGYAPAEEVQARFVWRAFDAPEWGRQRFPNGLTVDLSPVVLSSQPRLAGCKHLNRLEQVLIANQFSQGCQEMLACDSDGFVVEGCMSNLFWSQNGQLFTPKLDRSGVNGVVRRWLLSEEAIQQVKVKLDEVIHADAVFMTNCINGIVPVKRLASRTFDPQHAAWQANLALQQRLEAVFC